MVGCQAMTGNPAAGGLSNGSTNRIYEERAMHTCAVVWEVKQLYIQGLHSQIETVVKWWYFFNCSGLS